MTASDQQLKKRDYKPYEDPVELGINVILKCSSCNTPLVDIQVSRPKLEVETLVKAKCWKCGDFSYEQKILGGFHIAATKQSVIVDTDTDTLKDGRLSVSFNTIENRSKDDGKI